MTLDQAWTEAVAYLEAMPDWRQPQINMSFHRTDDCRRKVMRKNKSPIVYFHVQISLQMEPLAPKGEALHKWEWFQGTSDDAATAVNEAMAKLVAFMTLPELIDDGSDLV